MPELLRDFVVVPVVKIAVLLFLGILPLITYLVLVERKVLGYIQARGVPSRGGPWGLLQPVADVRTLLVQEDVLPKQAVKWAFVLAPCLVVAPASIVFSVIPVGPPGQGPRGTDLHITDVNVGVRLIIAL